MALPQQPTTPLSPSPAPASWPTFASPPASTPSSAAAARTLCYLTTTGTLVATTSRLILPPGTAWVDRTGHIAGGACLKHVIPKAEIQVGGGGGGKTIQTRGIRRMSGGLLGG